MRVHTVIVLLFQIHRWFSGWQNLRMSKSTSPFLFGQGRGDNFTVISSTDGANLPLHTIISQNNTANRGYKWPVFAQLLGIRHRVRFYVYMELRVSWKYSSVAGTWPFDLIFQATQMMPNKSLASFFFFVDFGSLLHDRHNCCILQYTGCDGYYGCDSGKIFC